MKDKNHKKKIESKPVHYRLKGTKIRFLKASY